MSIVNKILAAKRDDIDEYILPPEVQAIKNRKNDLAHAIIISDVLTLLEQYSVLTQIDKEAIQAVELSKGNTLATVELLDRIVRRKDFWQNFLLVLKDETAGLAHVAEELEREYEKVCAERAQDSLSTNTTEDLNTVTESTGAVSLQEKTEVEHKAASSISQQNQDSTGNDSTGEANESAVSKTSVVPKILKVSDRAPREYQLALAKPGLEGKNEVVCAPTGSGKTFVAALICKDHLSKRMSASDLNRAKILYLVPRFTILQHVFSELQSLLPLATVTHRHGGSSAEIPLLLLWEESDIVVATADILKNALLQNEMSICDVTLLFFDECHYAMDNHSYNQIMYEYHKKKEDKANDNPLPMIIGLTASPGAGGSLNPARAVEHILTLCGNLDAEVFQTVPEQFEEELEEYIHHPTKDKYMVSLNYRNLFIHALEEQMKQIEQMGYITASMHGTQQYESKMSDIIQKETATERSVYAKHLVQYNNALRQAHIAPENTAYDIIADFVTAELSERATLLNAEQRLLNLFQANDGRLRKIIQSIPSVNESLAVLKTCMLEHNREMITQGRKLRGMIFVRTISLAYALKKWIENDQDLNQFQPEVLIGSAKNEKEAMTKAQQLQIIRNFNSGIHSLLICTSVASEGVDIQECNVTVKYHHVTDEINMIQSRGRARAIDSKEIVIGMVQTTEKDRFNMEVEAIMKQAISEINKMSPEEFATHVKSCQAKIVAEWKTKEAKKAQLKSLFQASDIQLLCPGCPADSNHVCFLNEVKLYKQNSHIIPDEKFRDKIEEKQILDENQFAITKVLCKACGTNWGIIDSGYPCISVRSFYVAIKNTPPKKYKQWSKVPCTIERL